MILSVASVASVAVHVERLPSHTSTFSQPTYSNAKLKPKSYFKSNEENAQLANPGRSRKQIRCCEVRTEQVALGSEARVQRVLNSALAGYPVTIGVIGGSGTCSIQTGPVITYTLQFLPATVPERQSNITNMLSISVFPMVE